jgi:uncharacterized protein (UPF0332 family)
MLARRFYDLAERLANDTNSGTADYRTAISRAYYAAFHHAGEFLTDLGVKPSSGQGAHGGIPHALNASQDKEIEKSGSVLASLYTQRRKADYFLNDPYPEDGDNAKDAVSDCAKILINLDNCISDPTRKALVRTALRTWAVSRVGQNLNFSIF